MKIPFTLFIFLFSLLVGITSHAQTNLVSNPSFEQTSSNNIYIYITTLNFKDWIVPPNNGTTPDGFKNYYLGNCFPGGCWGNQHTMAGDTYAFAGEKFVEFFHTSFKEH